MTSRALDDMCKEAYEEGRAELVTRMIQSGELTLEKIADISQRSVEEVKNIAAMIPS